MMKFFRKYMKYLLAIFMALLVGVWIIGDPLSTFLRGDRDFEKEIRGEAFGRKVRLGEIRQAQHLTETLDAMRILWPAGWRYPLINLVFGRREIIPPEAYRLLMAPRDEVRQELLTTQEWFLLDLAAQKSGILVPREAVELFKQSWGISPELINAIRSGRQLSLETINEALSSLIRIQEAALQACEAVQISEADIQDFIRQTNEQIRVCILSVEAGKFLDAVPQPTDDEIQKHFEEYKNVASRPGETLEFGYQLPEAVQVEYVQINMASLIDRQKITEEEAFDYWQKNRGEFTKPLEASNATQPSQQKPAEPYATFSEARPGVMEKLAKNKAQREALSIAREMIKQLNKPWVESPASQPEGFKEIPDGARADTVYPQLIDRMEGRFGRIFKYTRTHLLESKEIRDLPEIGLSTALAGTPQQIPFMQAAFFVAGLKAKPADNPNHARFFRNLFETCAEPFIDPEGNVYVFRTTAIRPAQPPDSFASIRDQIVEDIRKQKAFLEAQKEAQALLATAEGRGLKTIFEQDANLREKLGENALNEPKPFTRKRLFSFRENAHLYPGMIPGFTSDPELVEKCFQLARGNAEESRSGIGLYEQKSSQRWLLIQWLETLPVTQEEYNQQRDVAVRYLRSRRQIGVLRSWFDPEQIRVRAQWKESGPLTQQDQKSPDDTSRQARQKTESKEAG